MKLFSGFKRQSIVVGILAVTLIAVTISPPLGNLFMGLSLISALSVKEIRSNLMALFKTPLGYSILAFCFILLFFSFFTQASYADALDDLSSWRKLLLLPLGLAVFMGNYDAQRKVVFFVICVLAILSLISYLDLLFPDFWSLFNKLPGLVFSNTATQTQVLGVGSLCAFVYLMFYGKSLSKAYRYILVFCFLLITSNVFFVSIGRSGYIAFFVMFIVAFLFLFKHKTLKFKLLVISLFCALIIGLGMSSTTVKKRVNLAIEEVKNGWETPQETSVGFRLTFYKETLKMMPNYLILGAGTGGFEAAYTKQVADNPPPGNVVTVDPHNQYFRFLIEQGIAGILLFGLLLIQLLRQKTTSEFTRILGISVLFGWLASSLFFSHFVTFPDGSFIWLWLGMMFASAKSKC